MSVAFLLPLTEIVLNKIMGRGLFILILVLGVGILILIKCKRDMYDYYTFIFAVVALGFALISPVLSNQKALEIAFNDYVLNENFRFFIDGVLDENRFGYNTDSLTDDEKDNYLEDKTVEISMQEDPSQDIVDWVIEKRNDIIYKDDIFTVEVYLRNVSENDKAWHKEIDAKAGDEIEFQIHYKNTGVEEAKSVLCRVSLPQNVTYVDNSTKLYNSNYPDGATYNSESITVDGISIGNYNINGDAYIRFRGTIADVSLVNGMNRLVTWVKVTSSGEALLDTADAYVEIK